jgi:hypothetical protein
MATKSAVPSHLKNETNGAAAGDRHHGKSQSHVVSYHTTIPSVYGI